MEPDVKRALDIGGGFGNKKASKNDPEGLHLPVRRQHLPEHPADPAAAELRRGMGVHQLQQRQPPDPHPRQRLSGAEGRRVRSSAPPPGCSRGASTTRTCPPPVIDENENRARARVGDAAHGIHRVHGHVRGPLPPPEPRGQRADGDDQRHSRGVDVRGGGAGRNGQAGDRAGARRQRGQGDRLSSPRSRRSRAPRRSRWPTSTAT